MKMAREHRVPLTNRMLAILDEAEKVRSGPFIFPNARGNQPLSEMALEMLMRRLNAKPATVHGFRSAFRDWAGEATNFPRELAEQALAHQVGDAVELAYRRGDALERRRALMEGWSAFCEPRNSETVSADVPPHLGERAKLRPSLQPGEPVGGWAWKDQRVGFTPTNGRQRAPVVGQQLSKWPREHSKPRGK